MTGSGAWRSSSQPTTPGEFEKGYINVLGVAADSRGLSLREFLAKMDLLVHGTTVSTNALVEGKVAAAGLICNAGHPDVLTLRESPRKRAFNIKVDFRHPLSHAAAPARFADASTQWATRSSR